MILLRDQAAMRAIVVDGDIDAAIAAAQQHARDVYAMRLLALGEAHIPGCQCGLCCSYADDDFTPDMGDPHEPNDERGWWRHELDGEPA